MPKLDGNLETAIHTEDMVRARAFYEGVFGWTFGGMTEPFVYLMTEGEQPVGAIFQSDEAGSGRPRPPNLGQPGSPNAARP